MNTLTDVDAHRLVAAKRARTKAVASFWREVDRLRRKGYTYGAIGDTLGITRQAVQQGLKYQKEMP